MGGAGGELPQRHKLFRLNELRLKALQIFQCLFGPHEQPGAVHLRKMAAHED